MTRRWFGVMVVLAVAAVCAPASGGDDAWPMYQANPAHTGYAPGTLDPARFTFRWERDFGGGHALNPVTAAAGKVFASKRLYFNNVDSLFTLSADTGEELWRKNFGSVFSVNPPSYGYGNVYVQTGNHGGDTYLRAYDANTGSLVFRSNHSAQWERYYAPTIYDGKVYINGGYFGGMYGFDAYTGNLDWFAGLPQYDDWTPAVDDNYAYAYVGEYSPGLYAIDRFTGNQQFMIPDSNFDWSGWSMNLAPVLGPADDVLVIHDGRLISFDLAQRDIRWEVARNFRGQPSLADGVIYAIDSGALVARDELTGGPLWSWEVPSAVLTGSIIVTDNLLIIGTASDVYAVDLATHLEVWSYPASGHLTLGDGSLYLAGADGRLIAITVPEPGTLTMLAIVGLMAAVRRR